MNYLAIFLLGCQLASFTAQTLEQTNALLKKQQETLVQLISTMEGMQDDIKTLREKPCQCKDLAKPVCNLTKNLALGKPALQSSTYYNPSYPALTFAANLAVDDNRNTDPVAGSCTHTLNYMNSWWAVDLLSDVTVNTVVLTNHGEKNLGYRLNNFYVSVTDVSPAVLAPKPFAGRVCTYYKGALADGATIQFQCPIGTVGRYLVVQHANHAEYLELCEVQVYGCPQ